ncbi:hypothetical protein BJ508DRAFT_181069 [Ascobolus immersus RN42]|uniref:Uncharacterized protein n=1 Tax=Ascobolus immersus RN42 TaxID=1160509 RepID=A0A3N4HXZ7_ASCIM|nr:hypothetical protein BJ508DRAFT_181069 [Ascobolus immersus RN42]
MGLGRRYLPVLHCFAFLSMSSGFGLFSFVWVGFVVSKPCFFLSLLDMHPSVSWSMCLVEVLSLGFTLFLSTSVTKFLFLFFFLVFVSFSSFSSSLSTWHGTSPFPLYYVCSVSTANTHSLRS